jgi:copper(I)-binding protein
MSFKSISTAFILMTSTAFADGIIVTDAYARSSRPNAPTGAAFMVFMNQTNDEVKLVGVRSEAAKRVELHTHIDKGEGIMQMTQIEGGIVIPAGETHQLMRGGDHVMLMGLNQSLIDGVTILVTFEFENTDDLTVEIPVDNERKPAPHAGHSTHKSN